MTALSVSQATQVLTVTRAIKSRSASRKEDGSYEMAPAASERYAIPNTMAQGRRCEG